MKNFAALDKLLLSVDDMAHLLSVPRRAIYSMMSSGRLPESFKVGKRRVWRHEEVVEWVRLKMPPLERFRELTQNQN